MPITTVNKRLESVSQQLLVSLHKPAKTADALALMAGVFMSLAFAPFNRFYLAWLGCALLFYLWHDARPRRAFRLGLWFGVGMFGASVSWVYVAMNVFGHMAAPLAVFFTIVFVLYLALFPAWTGWLLRKYFHNASWAGYGLAAASLWVVFEWLRGWLFTGFPWLLLGYSQLPSPLSGYAPVLGVFGVSGLTALLAVWLVLAWRASRGLHDPRVRQGLWLPAVVMTVWNLWQLAGQPLWFFNEAVNLVSATAWVHGMALLLIWPLLALALVVLNYYLFGFIWAALESLWQRQWGMLILIVLVTGVFLDQVSWSRPAGEPLTVSVLQGNVPQDVKWRRDQQRKTLALYAEMTQKQLGDDIIVFPENALPVSRHLMENGYLKQLDETARQAGSALIIGLPDVEQAERRYYNAMAVYGQGEGVYKKSHLVPFGEYIPLKSMLGGLLEIMKVPMSDFSAGAWDQPLVTAHDHPVAVTICYEDIFPGEVIRHLPEAALLVNASNNAWYGDSLAPHQHLQIARMRAKETSRYVLRATTNGISAVIDERGRILARSQQFQTAVTESKAVARRGWTPYVVYGNVLAIGLALLVLGGMQAKRWLPGYKV